MPESDKHLRNRRNVLKAIAATSAMGALAGCSGGDGGDGDGGDGGGTATQTMTETDTGDGGDTTTGDGGDMELGERVPSIVLMYPSVLGTWQETVPLVKDQVENALDVTVELLPVEVPKFIGDQRGDARTYHYAAWRFDNSPQYYDLGDTARSFAVDWAGANEQGNWANYANCEYSKLILDARRIGDPDERLDTIQEALTIYSNDRVDMPLMSADKITAIRKKQVDVGGTGKMGATTFNRVFFVETTPKNGDRWVVGTLRDFAQSTNHLQIETDINLSPWIWLVHSPLLGFDENRELVKVLAEDYTVDGDTVTFTISDEATFHNGDPVTAEDAKFTIETINGNSAVKAQTVTYDFESVTAVDEKTLEVTFASPGPTFVNQFMATWGILHKDTWESMEEVSSFTPDEVIGSGPFELESFTQDQSMSLTPSSETHPVSNPDHSVVIFEYDDSQARLRAFQENEVQVANDVVGSAINKLERQMSEDELQVTIGRGIGPWKLLPSYPRAPVRFNEFADAVGMAINRQEINNVVTGGRATEVLYSSMYLLTHPQSPPAEDLHFFTEEPAGEPDRARQVLEDAGWGWDDDGNLRYPADKDTTPLWPKGEEPSPEDFPCLNEMGG